MGIASLSIELQLILVPTILFALTFQAFWWADKVSYALCFLFTAKEKFVFCYCLAESIVVQVLLLGTLRIARTIFSTDNFNDDDNNFY